MFIAIKLVVGQQLVLDRAMGYKFLFEGLYRCSRNFCHFLEVILNVKYAKLPSNNKLTTA